MKFRKCYRCKEYEVGTKKVRNWKKNKQMMNYAGREHYLDRNLKPRQINFDKKIGGTAPILEMGSDRKERSDFKFNFLIEMEPSGDVIHEKFQNNKMLQLNRPKLEKKPPKIQLEPLELKNLRSFPSQSS